jgi:hypothetical protein
LRTLVNLVWIAAKILAVICVVLAADLLLSAAIRQRTIDRNAKLTWAAELTQEPYAGSDWGAAYWNEIAQYQEHWSPYIVYRVQDMKGQFIRVSGGVRRTYVSESTSPDDKRPVVMVFGGSAAWGHGARDDQTLPSWLARVAQENGVSLDVRNYAESGWVNWQGIVYLMEKLADGERPDVVVFFSGANEVITGRHWPSIRRPIWDWPAYPRAMRAGAIHRTAPLQSVWTYYRSTSLTLSFLFGEQLADTPSPTPTSETLVEKLTADILTDVAVVEGLGRQYGFRPLFVWQSTVADKQVLTDQEQTYAGWRSAAPRPALDWWSMPSDLKNLHQEVGRRVQAKGAVIGLGDPFEGLNTSAFIDWVHPSEAGHERIARALYRHLQPLLRMVDALLPALHQPASAVVGAPRQ